MSSPLDAVTVFHNAFRADMARIDAAALAAAQGAPGLDSALESFTFMNEVLDWHAEGEEEAVFTTLEGLAPRLAWAYDRDHRGLDAAFAEFTRCMSLRDPLQTARATAAFTFHLDLHLAKEDAQVYPLVEEGTSLDEQGAILGRLSGRVPRDRFPEVVAWLFPLVDIEDRATMARIYQRVQPPEVVAGLMGIVRGAIGDDDYAALAAAVPGLPG
jgi:hypothetical protein